MALVAGGIPAGLVDAMGHVVTVDTFPIKGGQNTPVCYEHWRDDDYTFTRGASWFVTDAGASFLHWLDLARPLEAHIYQHIANGIMYLSWGKGATAAALKVVQQPPQPKPVNPRPRRIILPIEHWSYTLSPAYHQQPPIKIISIL